MEKELDTEKLIPGLFAQVQALDVIVTALMRMHPEPDELREGIKHHLSLTTAFLATKLVSRELPQDLVTRVQKHVENRLALMD